ncbi:hypothetical protein [Arthrobacter cavernae]|uniref:Uncharacterized protein n=1 Tax=Arthrobacter cavernae TaxID=2817681 RepID=A0A939HFJ9_9MICC|nr:hypothetical protein [Arthrobacter cavernae]MBO1270002.1 hypothetical protein [Arthrobacter cavernae]
MAVIDPGLMGPGELVLHLKAVYGYTWKELGERLGRSERMLRKVATGQSRGEAYREALTELFERGEVTHMPSRRRGRDGHLVPVRAKAGVETKTVVPEDTGGTFARLSRRGSFHSTSTDFPGGGRQYSVQMPKTARAKGRLAGIHELHRRLLSISRSQARHDKRVKLQLVYRTDGRGRVMEIGSKSGYHASDILTDVRDLHGGDMVSWIVSQSRERYENLDLKKSPLVSVTMTVFNAIRPKPVRKAQDAAGTRRRRRR